jgi:hypothetical protein
MLFPCVCDTLNAVPKLSFLCIHRLFFIVPSETVDRRFTLYRVFLYGEQCVWVWYFCLHLYIIYLTQGRAHLWAVINLGVP